MKKIMKEYYAINDLIALDDKIIAIIPKKRPYRLGWGCNCGFTTTKRKKAEKHALEKCKPM